MSLSKWAAKRTTGSPSPSNGSQTSPLLSKSKKPTFSFDGDVDKLLNLLEKGDSVLKVRLSKQWNPANRKLCLQRESGQLVLCKAEYPGKHSSRPKCFDIREIKEVTSLDCKLHFSKVVERWRRDRDLSCFDVSRFMLVYHGNQFVLDLHIFLFDSQETCVNWVHGLKYLISECRRVSHPIVVERWLRKEFYRMQGHVLGSISVKDLKPFLKRIQYQIDSNRFREIVQTALKASEPSASAFAGGPLFRLKEKLNFENFAQLYRSLSYVHTIFSSNFARYSDDNVIVTSERFAMWQKCEQEDETLSNPDNSAAFLRSYICDVDPSRDSSQPFLSREEFEDFLFSAHNTIFDPTHELICQDMDQPLCNYWIASSHNTYLTGDQLKSESSLEAYARALMMGCRSIELDCWDGAEGAQPEIIIYHGYTLTTKLQFPDVLKAIRDYAFVTSEQAVILSIENNCSLPFQRQMAVHFREILGELLLTEPVGVEADVLPSPNQLKRKIILKHKKLALDTDQATAVANHSALDDSSREEMLLSHPDTRHRGILHLKDSKTEVWHPHIFVLTSDRLLYSEDTSSLLSNTSQPRPDGNDDAVQQRDDEEVANLSPEDLHLSEVWFHGKIAREEAEKLLRQNAMIGEGLFLVRESTNFPGDYTLSYWYHGSPYHSRIKTTQVGGERKYFFQDRTQMDTLYELISLHQERPLVTPKFSILLKTPCPELSLHEGQAWYAGDIHRAKAEELLNLYPRDGTFLIRKSQTDMFAFTLSFRVDGSIQHCRLKQEGRLFIVKNVQFENLVQLVDYYTRHQLYHGICLKFPVNQKTIQDYALGASHAPPGSYMELQGVATTAKVRAKYDYVARSDEELSFAANAIIQNVTKLDEAWWFGEHQGQKGFFPRAYVEELSPETAAATVHNSVCAVLFNCMCAVLCVRMLSLFQEKRRSFDPSVPLS